MALLLPPLKQISHKSRKNFIEIVQFYMEISIVTNMPDGSVNCSKTQHCSHRSNEQCHAWMNSTLCQICASGFQPGFCKPSVNTSRYKAGLYCVLSRLNSSTVLEVGPAAPPIFMIVIIVAVTPIHIQNREECNSPNAHVDRKNVCLLVAATGR
jgi:hypothetical protein